MQNIIEEEEKKEDSGNDEDIFEDIYEIEYS